MLQLDEKVISPYKETISYEILSYLFKEKELASYFKKNMLPSSVLEIISLLDYKEITELVKKIINPHRGDFSVCINGDYQYPEKLRDAKDPIELFYYKGNLDLIDNKCISIVGSRKCSQDGLGRTKKLTKELVKRGYTIVSGLAKGVDTVALNTAIMEKGDVIGVIGTPINHYYPKENKELQDLISKEHLLISQVPIAKYEKISFKERRFFFPKRNATMSAISGGTVIVEAGETSGSLTQARAALQQGRKLFILNSCFENEKITWPAYYEKKGAIRVYDISDILDNL